MCDKCGINHPPMLRTLPRVYVWIGTKPSENGVPFFVREDPVSVLSALRDRLREGVTIPGPTASGKTSAMAAYATGDDYLVTDAHAINTAAQTIEDEDVIVTLTIQCGTAVESYTVKDSSNNPEALRENLLSIRRHISDYLVDL